MSSFFRTIAMSVLAGATILANPLSVMAADSVTPAATEAPPVAATQQTPRETVEQRITNLHSSLNITASEEADWNGVTKAMRNNARVMEKLVAEKSTKDTTGMTAMDDLKTYGKFAQAHVEGLKSLTVSFARLYQAMPAAQKKIADQVFQNFGHEHSESHS
jgi:LTXXQ motif family protein